MSGAVSVRCPTNSPFNNGGEVSINFRKLFLFDQTLTTEVMGKWPYWFFWEAQQPCFLSSYDYLLVFLPGSLVVW